MNQNVSTKTVQTVLAKLLTPHQFQRVSAAANNDATQFLAQAMSLKLVSLDEYERAEALAISNEMDVETALGKLGYATFLQRWSALHIDQSEMLARAVPVESWATNKEVLTNAPLVTEDDFEQALCELSCACL